jgi:hypothetical protein
VQQEFHLRSFGPSGEPLGEQLSGPGRGFEIGPCLPHKFDCSDLDGIIEGAVVEIADTLVKESSCSKLSAPK